ncbi:exodeoxyribonuclease V subunit alpha [Singulisphaera sp. PoT]|uniref:exodeoxyribonuclease V subunit alpha n=1 Tax=Singulisphaera sp. PoT TaxID=3411797 RepID=UPI003BF56B97
MSVWNDLSPLGVARASLARGHSQGDPDAELLRWLAPVRERVRTLYNLDDEIPFLAWELARWQAGLNLEDRRALVMLVLSALVHMRQGSTRLPLVGEAGRKVRLEMATQLLGETEADHADDGEGIAGRLVESAEAILESGRADVIVGGVGEYKPLLVDGPYLYLQKMRYLEDSFVAAFGQRLDESTAMVEDEEALARAVADVFEHPAERNGFAVVLSVDQLIAVKTAARYPVAVISGGPGTGKTTIVVSILRALRRLGVLPEEIALAAPTGKAANRLGQAIRSGLEGIPEPSKFDRELLDIPEPRTLHRLLGYSARTGRFQHHENHRLSERVVVVDESSMIDLSLMERLVRSTRDDGRFLLLGDARQLPSVEAGAVLRDLLGDSDDGANSPLGARGVRLTKSHRMRAEDEDGRNVLTVAQTFDRGEAAPLGSSRETDATIISHATVAAIRFRGVEAIEIPAGSTVLDEFLDRWHRDVVQALDGFKGLAEHEYSIDVGELSAGDEEKIRRLHEHFERARILCLTRVLPTGADRLNALLHAKTLASQGRPLEADFVAGEPVMMLVNDYHRRIFNGDQGLIVNMSERSPARPMAVFPRPDGLGIFHLDTLRPVLSHAYAMTVHKSQGSEFDKVALVLPERDLPINTREVLYTALTRSKGSVVILGDNAVLNQGVSKSIRRDSGIAEKLAARRPGNSA